MPNPPLASFLGFLLGFLSIFGGIPGEVWCGAIGIPIPTGCGTNRGGRRIEYRKMAAKKRKKRRSSCVFAPFAPFCGYSFGPACGLCYGLLRKLLGRRTRKCKMRLISTLAFPRQTWIRCPPKCHTNPTTFPPARKSCPWWPFAARAIPWSIRAARSGW